MRLKKRRKKRVRKSKMKNLKPEDYDRDVENLKKMRGKK